MHLLPGFPLFPGSQGGGHNIPEICTKETIVTFINMQVEK
jgi:hypothetical protein